MRIRKLFPSQPPNINDDPLACYGPCCPFNCYSFYSPPPPPPLQNDQRISPAIITIVSLLSFTFLLVSYYFIFGRSWLERRRRRSNHQEADHPTADNRDGGDDGFQFLGQNQVHHPIWHIATVGLQQSVINSITVCKYKKGQGLIEGTECSVCLNEFHEDAMLRLLPKCNHAFHVSCIDTWLRSHTNCPLCRAHIVNEVRPGSGPVSAHHDGSSPNPAAAQMENSGDVRVVSTDGGERADVTNNNCDSELKEEEEEEEDRSTVTKKLRRSNSMDSLPDAAVILSNCESGSSRNSSGSSSSSTSTTAVSMKRSNSSGGRFFLSRINRGQSVVLPL